MHMCAYCTKHHAYLFLFGSVRLSKTAKLYHTKSPVNSQYCISVCVIQLYLDNPNGLLGNQPIRYVLIAGIGLSLNYHLSLQGGCSMDHNIQLHQSGT